MTVTATAPVTLTAECATCEACQMRRSVPMPANVLADENGVIDWWEAQDTADELDCHCDHDTCASLRPGHGDGDECDWCQHRYDADEDFYRDR